MKKKQVSIIIRTKDEEKWISSCLKSVFCQTFKDFEVVIVDNKSRDRTLAKAGAFDVKVLEIDSFLPGNALNHGIRHGQGDIIVCLSGHCIPVNNQWLANLVRNVEEHDVAGAYGRQEPMSFSSDYDKRDLITVFGLDKKVQIKDPFFHNANSVLRRDVWEEIPFDERVTNIEDRIWGKQVIEKGYRIIYEPEASVYHYHGIHQGGDRERCKNVVRILESLEVRGNDENFTLDVNDLNIMALIPIKGDVPFCGKRPLMDYTIERALESTLVNKVVVSTDDPEVAKIARKGGAETPFIRPSSLSREYVDINMVAQYSLNQLEKEDIFPDAVIIMEITYPFRPPGLINNMIASYVKNGFESLVPARKECRYSWLEDKEHNIRNLTDSIMPRRFKETPVYISLFGLGSITNTASIREGSVLGNSVGVYEITSSYSAMQISNNDEIKLADQVIEEWWKSV